MKTESGGLTRPLGTAAHRPPGLSARHLLTPRHGHRALRLPLGRLENRLLVTGPLTRLTRPTLRYSGSLSPRLPLGIGPYSLTSPTLPAEPQYHPENQHTVNNTQQASEDPAEVASPLPAYDLSCRNYEDLERGQVGLDAEGLRDVPDPSQNRDAALRRRKVELLNEVCCSLIKGANFSETENQTRQRLQTLCEEIAQQDPEFILKVALYTRQELNIRTTANFLLALSAWIPSSRPHLRRYFCQAVRLPSDWIEVAWLYQSLASDSGRLAPFPSCLRQSLSDRFKGFDEYQLAKYNTRKQRCKSSQPRSGKSTPTLSDTDLKARFSLKKLIGWLHLKDPTYHVMCLLGRRYPSDLQSFARSRLPGPWDSRRSGKRMKLQLPESWERELSLHGNRAEVWERLIDHQKLPYMAMLRNLRNIMAAGVSRGHHAQLLRRLTDRDAVIRSRQFPFRFLAAYKALVELQRRLDEKDEPLPTKAALVQQALETSMRPPRKLRELLGRARKAGPGRQPAPRVAYAYRWATKRLADLRKSRIVRYDQELLESYRQALAVAVEISATHNVPPLPGRTAILCCVDHNMGAPCVSARALHVPRSRTPEEVEEAKAWKSPVILEVAILLALMARHVSEHAELVLFNSNTYCLLQLDSGGLLANVDRVLQEAQSLQQTEVCDFYRSTGLLSYLTDCVENHVKIDTILQLDCTSYHSNLREKLQFYRYHVNPELLFVLVSMSSIQCSVTEEADGKEIYLNGCSEQILRFVCERGSSRLLEHVEGIDNVFQLPQGRGGRRKRRRMEVEPAAVSPLLPTPKLRWRSVRVFVSSTFRDMHSERDLLIRSVFPELRARASRHLLRIDEVDLRWGITEEDSRGNRQLALCLSEVVRCDLFVGILGERYGQTLSEYPLPDLPEFKWVKSYPKQRSITELEIMQFLRLHDVSPSEHAFFYTRDPAVLSSIPEEYRPDFESESEEARSRVSELKSHLKEAGLLVLENYRSAWGASVSGRAFLSGLEEFGASVLDALWKAIIARYCQADWGQAPDEDALQGAFQEAQGRQQHGRFRQLEEAASAVRGVGGRRPTGPLVVHGNPGEGKTAFLASLVTLLSSRKAEPPSGETELLFHFTGATQSSSEAGAMLHRLCRLLVSRLTAGEGGESLPPSYRALVLEFHSLLARFAECHPRGHLVLLIDGADCVQTHNKQRASDWIPETVPHRVTLVLSVMEDSPLHRALAARRGVVTVRLGPLDPLDRSEIVRRRLAVFGKRLEESPFNNQMRQLVMKKESHNPLFLRLASDELREYGVFEKVSERIRALPPTLSSLIQHSLGCLEQEQGQHGVSLALSALHVSTRGLRESDLYCLLCTSRGLPVGSPPPAWEEVMQEALKPSRPVPMATFARLMRSLRRILVIWSPLVESSACLLHLSSSLLRTAVGQRYLGDGGHVRQLHLLLAVRLWTLVDPEGEGRFTNCDPEALPDLPQHLIRCGQLPRLASLLSNLQFCSLHVRLGLLSQLNVTHNLYHAEAGRGEGPMDDEVSHYRRFLATSAPVLGAEPALFWQQALNQPEGSPVRAQALRCLLDPPEKLPEGLRLVEWTNRPQASACQGKVMMTPTVPLCVDISPSGRLALVGTSEGYLHILDLESGEEAGSLASTCDGISNCGFLDESTVFATSFDGKMEAWGLAEGYRLFQVEAHSDRITGCALSPDGKHLASSSWDRALKLWAVTSGKLDVSLENTQPLNCVTFHPEGRLVAVASWDRTVRVWDWVTASQVMVLEGVSSSVRALCYSPSGEFLASASLLGEVLLWSCPSGSEAGRYRAHSGPITQLRYLASGNHLVTTGTDHQVRIWSGSLGQAQGEYGTESTSPALCLSVSQNQERLAVGYHSDQLQVFQLATGALVTVCKGPPLPVRCLQWLKGEVLLAAGTDDNLLRVWSLRGSRGSCKHLCRGHTRPPVCLSLSEYFLASASEDFTVLLWPLAQLIDLESGAELSPACVLRGHADAVTCCAFSPDGQRLLTGSKDKTLLFWDIAAVPGRVSRALPSCHRDWITGCCWAPRYVVSCSNDGTVRLWDPDTGECLRQLKAKSATFSSVSVSGDLVLSVTGNGELIVWKESGAVITTISGHSQRITNLVVFIEKVAASDVLGEGEQQHPLGKLTAITASEDGAVRRWYPLQVDEVATLPGHSGPVTGAAVGPGAPSLLTVSADHTLRLWEGPTQKDVESRLAHGGAVTALCWSLSGEFLVSGSRNGEVKVWRSGTVLHSAQAHRKQISAVVFLSDSTFALASYDKVVSVWELTQGQHPPSVRVTLQTSFSLEFPVGWLTVLPGLGQLMVGDLRGNLTLWTQERGPWRAWDSSRGYFLYYFSWVIERTDGSLLVVESPRQTYLRIFHMPSAHSEETETEGSEGTEQGADLHPDWVKLTMGDAYFDLAPWGSSQPEASDPSLWLTVVKASRARRPGGARSMLCADSQGSLWCSQWDPTVTPLEEPHVQELSKWTHKQVHADRVTAVTETEELIVTASYDRTVRLWDCESWKQVGLFSCRAPVLCLEANPADPDLGACGDAGGNIYFLRWSSCPSPSQGEPNLLAQR